MCDFEWEFPYPSRRMPVLARNVVATSQPLAAQAGLRMLLAGGSAADATIAAAVALVVVEPMSNSVGADAFAIIWDGKTLAGLNASGRSPAAWSPEYFAGRRTMPTHGWDSVTVPGAVSAWVELSRRYGKLPFADLFAPAVEYARGGFVVSPLIANGWQSGERLHGDDADFAEAFLPAGRAPKAGQTFACPDLARTLDAIAETEGEAFYRGELAERIARTARQAGGAMTAQDLAEHIPRWVAPISLDYRGWRLHEIPPNGQGLAALLMLGILRHTGISNYGPDSSDGVHLQTEAMKLAFADAHRYVADPEHADIPIAGLLDDDYLAARAALIDMEQAKAPDFGRPRGSDTVYLTAADAAGMMVSFIQSSYHGWGSGVVIPHTGINMQNRGAGFTLQPNHPNRVAGRKRPFHTIIPAFVTRDDAAVMSFGVMGGPMQPQGHAQMMVRIFDYGQNPQAALDAPRWRVIEGRKVALERAFGADVIDELRRRGHQVQVESGGGFGGGQIIYRLDDGYIGASEPRKDGQAVGF